MRDCSVTDGCYRKYIQEIRQNIRGLPDAKRRRDTTCVQYKKSPRVVPCCRDVTVERRALGRAYKGECSYALVIRHFLSSVSLRAISTVANTRASRHVTAIQCHTDSKILGQHHVRQQLVTVRSCWTHASKQSALTERTFSSS